MVRISGWCPQYTPVDLQRKLGSMAGDRIDGSYFTYLYKWLVYWGWYNPRTFWKPFINPNISHLITFKGYNSLILTFDLNFPEHPSVGVKFGPASVGGRGVCVFWWNWKGGRGCYEGRLKLLFFFFFQKRKSGKRQQDVWGHMYQWHGFSQQKWRLWWYVPY